MAQDKIIYVSPDEVKVVNNWNARSGDWTKVVDQETGEGWDSFVASIHSEGIKTPIEVRPIAGKVPYEAVAGFRRHLAAISTSYKNEKGEEVKVAPLEKIPVIVREMTEAEARLRNIQENTARENLKGADLAWAIRELVKNSNGSMNDTKIANAIGLSQPYVGKLNKIMVDVKPALTKAWRDATVKISVKEMYQLAHSAKDRQDEVFNSLVQARSAGEGEDSKGPGSWLKTLKKKAFNLGFTLGTMKRLEFIEGVEGEWIEVLEQIVTVPSKAKAGQKKAAVKELEKGFERGMAPPPDEEEEEEDDE